MVSLKALTSIWQQPRPTRRSRSSIINLNCDVCLDSNTAIIKMFGHLSLGNPTLRTLMSMAIPPDRRILLVTSLCIGRCGGIKPLIFSICFAALEFHLLFVIVVI
jgi:hypothetical protein